MSGDIRDHVVKMDEKTMDKNVAVCNVHDDLSILETHDLIVETILKFLPMKDLHSSARVCKKWQKCANRVKRKRTALGWFLYNYDRDRSSGSGIADEMKEKVEEFLERFASEPRQAVLFCSSSLMEHGMPQGSAASSSTATRPGPRKKSKKRLVGIDKYLQSRLPLSCEMHGICADGVIGTRPDGKIEELEDQLSLACLLVPDNAKVHIHTFYKGDTMQDFSREQDLVEVEEHIAWLSGPYLPTLEEIQRFTGLPAEHKPRLVLLFYTTPYYSIGQSKMDLVQGMLRHYGNLVVAGGVVDSFFMDKLNEANMPGGASCVHGIVFCGSEDQVSVASVLIEPWLETVEQIETKLQKLKGTHIPEKNSIGFMFACIGRGQQFHEGQENVESGLFYKLFPNTPLFGFFGNGEIGYDYLPDYSKPQGDKGYSIFGDDNSTGDEHDDEDASHPTSHGYSTIFVIMSIKQ